MLSYRVFQYHCSARFFWRCGEIVTGGLRLIELAYCSNDRLLYFWKSNQQTRLNRAFNPMRLPRRMAMLQRATDNMRRLWCHIVRPLAVSATNTHAFNASLFCNVHIIDVSLEQKFNRIRPCPDPFAVTDSEACSPPCHFHPSHFLVVGVCPHPPAISPGLLLISL